MEKSIIDFKSHLNKVVTIGEKLRNYMYIFGNYKCKIS